MGSWRFDRDVAVAAVDPERKPDVELTAASPPAMTIVPIEMVTVTPQAMVAPEVAVSNELREVARDVVHPQAAERVSSSERGRSEPRTGAGTGADTVAGPGTDEGSPLMSMRSPYHRPGAAGTAAILAHIAEGGPPLPEPVHPSGRIAHVGTETRINDLTFTAKVEPDGTAHIEDKGNVHVHFALPSPKVIGREIARWAEDPYAYNRTRAQPGDLIEQAPRGDHAVMVPGLSKEQRGEQSALIHDDDTPEHAAIVPVIGGGFDLTAWVSQKALGKAQGDVYAARKRVALEQTFDERVEMGLTFRKQRLDHVDQTVRESLDRLWASRLALRDKKQALFELWDDCAEAGEPAIVAAAVRARADIVGFVNAHLAPGSIDAFSPAELDALNAHRSSHARFAPYANAQPPPIEPVDPAPLAPPDQGQ